MKTHNPYLNQGNSVGQRQDPNFPSQKPNGHCGLPKPKPAGPEECGDQPGQNYCRGHMGGTVTLAAGATGVITMSPVNAVEFAARWFHMTATSAIGVSPVTFTQAFTVSRIAILGDNQMANDGPVIGSTWSAQQTYLEVFWNRTITTTNPLSVTVTNLDAALGIQVYAAVAGDFVKS